MLYGGGRHLYDEVVWWTEVLEIIAMIKDTLLIGFYTVPETISGAEMLADVVTEAA